MDRIAEIRERLEKATPGVWRTVEKGNSIPSIAVETLAYVGEPSIKICSGISPKTKNAEFIAHAHEDIPYLLDVIEQQQAEIERLKPIKDLWHELLTIREERHDGWLPSYTSRLLKALDVMLKEYATKD